MKLTISCAMCGGEVEIPLDTQKVTRLTMLGDIITGRGWIVQQNGKHFDIYCTKECAK